MPELFALLVKIGEMIAVDCQPLSIVSDPGFVRLLGTVEPRYQISIIIFFFFSGTNNKFYKNYSYFIGIGYNKAQITEYRIIG